LFNFPKIPILTRLDLILKEKKLKKLSWDKLAENLPVTGEALRIAFKRGSVDDVYLSAIEAALNISKDVDSNKKSNISNDLLNTNGNKFTEKPDGSFDIEVSLIPFEAYASYLVSVEEATVHQDFERVVFNVDRYGRGHYQAFKINGNSMNGGSINDVPDGALVLGRELGRHLWKDGFRPADHGFVILSKENIFHKDIIDFDTETGDITCQSRNKSPEYTDFKLNLNDVYQIFRVIKRQM